MIRPRPRIREAVFVSKNECKLGLFLRVFCDPKTVRQIVRFSQIPPQPTPRKKPS